jgi:hypothetical protein
LTPCLHDSGSVANALLDPAWGEVSFVTGLYKDEGGAFTYTMMFADRTHRVRCGHDLQEYPKSLKREIRTWWKGDMNGKTWPHFLGDMTTVL